MTSDEIDQPEVLPRIVRRALKEVDGCIQGGAYAMALVAARRGLEALCHDQGAVKGTLEQRLGQLSDEGKIDGRLAEWATHLRNIGNEGAHDLDFEPDGDEARDSHALLRSMVRYVYIDQTRYEEAKRRWEYRRLPPLRVAYQTNSYSNGCQILAVLEPSEISKDESGESRKIIHGWINHISGFVLPSERSIADIEDDKWAPCRQTIASWIQPKGYRVGKWKRIVLPDKDVTCPDERHKEEPPF